MERMNDWWKEQGTDLLVEVQRTRAVAYYRHSAQDRQENSIPIQKEQVRKWADANQVEIIKEFADHGKSGLSAEHRDAFNDMLENWVKKEQDDFRYVLVLDVSRWGRFQDIDLSATYSAECTRHGKQVVYTSLGLPKKDDPIHAMAVSFERYRAAQYSRELSGKVFNGCAKVAQQGFRPGGSPPYGLHRLLLNEAHKPVQILKPRERKSIQNQRVTLAPGDKKQSAVVQRIFKEFALGDGNEQQIADGLNRDGIASPGGVMWDVGKIRRILTNELYIGTMVYNKSTQRLLAPTRRNPRSEWIRTPAAFEGIIPKELFAAAEGRFDEQERRRTPEFLLEELKRTYERHGVVTRGLVKSSSAPSLHAYHRLFRTLDDAFQQAFDGVRGDVVRMVRAKLDESVPQVEEYADFFVLNGRLTVLVQPSVPVSRGYESYWMFRPDPRPVIDITLCVLLSSDRDRKILGYVAIPRLLARTRFIRVYGPDDPRIELFGHDGLDFIKQLLA
jgi:DNA invertase Pin-like site-specific DNA recombinase